ncbi:MAG: PD-(D/E)XK nuclease family protein [Armatimonadetes bacterium]|nr:PD-(D/E)XK nuclease family protein [Armatimonadota bacterium]
MPKPTISPSKMSTYLACPVRYRWTYVDGRGRLYLRAKRHFSFGTTLHRVLEKFYSEDQTGAPVRETLMAAFDESWVDAGFSTPEEMSEAYGEGREILERMSEEIEQKPRPGKPLYIEKRLKFEYPDFTLIGQLDRVDEHPDGSLEIIDYKSGRSSISSEEVGDDLAMGVYQLLLSKLHPDRPIRATIIALRTGEEATASLSAEQLAELEADIQLLGGEIVTQEFFELEPRPKALCASCDFLRLCQKHPDFREEPGS